MGSLAPMVRSRTGNMSLIEIEVCLNTAKALRPALA
jgi:hypothetical protein